MAEADSTSDTTPVPRRFWWLKRIAVVMLLLAGVVVGLRYAALWRAQRQFTQEIESIRQSGDPVYAQDFAAPSGAGDGAVKLLEAARHFQIPRQSIAAWNALPRSGYSTAEMAMIDAVLEGNRQYLKLVREARQQPLGSPGYDPSWGTANGVPMFNEFSQLADALSKAGHRSSQNGDDAEAVEYLRDQLSVQRLLEHYPYPMAHLIAAEIISHRISQDATSTAVPLKIKFAAQEGQAASEAQVRGLIADLLDENRGPRSGWRWRWVGERFMNLNAMAIIDRQASEAPDHERLSAWWTRPMTVWDQTNILRAASAEVKAAEADDLAIALEMLMPPRPSGGTTVLWKVRTIRGQMMETAFMEHFQSVRQRRQAAIALAERMHELKYGKPAQRVQELVPEFLPSVPLDPVAGGGKTLGLSLPMQAPAVREQGAR